MGEVVVIHRETCTVGPAGEKSADVAPVQVDPAEKNAFTAAWDVEENPSVANAIAASALVVFIRFIFTLFAF